MEDEKLESNRKKIVFLSSSFVNLAKLFAENNSNYDIFLIMDRRFPFEIPDLDNFYVYFYDKNKIFEKSKSKYFDELGVFVDSFEPDLVITNNFTKLLPDSFIEFMKFRNSKIKIINIHHGDLRILDENNDMKLKGLSADIKSILQYGQIISTIHLIEDEGMDTGNQLAYSHPTDLKQLKQKGYINNKEDILNLRMRSVVLSFHERTKVLNLLKKTIENL